MKLKIINGPNLNLLGTREPEIYGDLTFKDYLEKIKQLFSDIEIDYFQSNIEGEIINEIQNSENEYDGLILNAAGYTHTSVSIADTVKAVNIKVVEVHISNIFSREEYRHISLIAPNVNGSIIGFGLDSYRLAIESFINPITT
jgi:3-dehydroquinate dehydratase-2